MTHPIAPADGTNMDIISPNLLQEFIHWKTCKYRPELLAALNPKDDPQVLLLAPVAQKSIIADFLET